MSSSPDRGARSTPLYLQLQLQIYFVPVNALVRLVVLLRRLFGPDKHAPRRYLSILLPFDRRLSTYLHSPAPGPQNPSSPSSTGKTRRKPVHINFHGGGFCLPLHGTDARFCALVAREAGCYVLDASYRRAPSHPFPAAYDDARAVLAWVREDTLGLFDTSRITVGGFSAGGNLALALAATAEPGVQGMIAFYPPVDLTGPYSRKPAPARTKLDRNSGMVISPSDEERSRKAYLLALSASEQALPDPRYSPLFASPDKFPGGGRTMILTCEYDYLAAEGEALARALEEAGREPVAIRVEGKGHSWDGMCVEGSEGARVRDEMWLRAAEVVRHAQA
ncbi:hypothetical protein CALCODRAFT_440514 [Calocera cornea HHB12733]|uniref:Alpha/beta hydrolase fold-3 domain-containing protein n=1 Tax=Calocera cornea HHB12733 TaxID=1353952 RepID=A0A165DMJ7_9BASI|nr:hypothetical protein CALCODRAFT_440514 [Calocera cornea HHB12733]